MTTEAFKKWALSFSGCNGGNLEGKTWLCGFEYGGKEIELKFNLQEITEVPWIDPNKEDDCGKTFIKYHFNWRAIKLLAAVDGKECKNYREFYKTRQCFKPCSDYFMLNLFPIAFPSVNNNWPSWLVEKTGFNDKEQYREWCRIQRFPIIRSWIEKYSPKLVICVGKTYVEDFRRAFGNGEQDIDIKTGCAKGKNFNWFLTNDGKTLVVVTYFLGYQDSLLNSDVKLKATGDAIRQLLSNNK